MKKNKNEISQSLPMLIFIILSGGLQDAYSYFCRDGVKTELTQQRYVPGKDVRNIRILDAQQGRVLAAYDTKTGTVHDVDKDGTTYTQQMNWDVYGVIALDDLLAGSTDFTPLNFAE